MDDAKLHAEPRHPIGVVATRTGLPQDLIRAWERRYDAVTPGRGRTGRRLYSDDDIEKLRLLRRAVTGGRRISDVAGLDVGELRSLVAEDHTDTPGATRTQDDSPSASPKALLAEAVEALEAMDRHGLERVLAEASVQLSGPSLRRDLIAPLLDIIGDRWQEGSLRIVHEHLASTIVRTFMSSSRNGREHAPRIIVTTPPGQHHELGALMAAAVAEEGGWDVYYLGPNLPAEEIAAAVRQLRARAVALSIVYRDGENIADELKRLQGLLDGVPLFVGGRATESVRERLVGIGVACPRDLREFREELQAVLA